MAGKYVNSPPVKLLAFAPIIGAFLEIFISKLAGAPFGYLWVVTIILNAALALLDERVLTRGGLDTTGFRRWFWLAPAYLFKRTEYLRNGKVYFFTWIGTFSVAVLIRDLTRN
jgi:hypothetical protein